MTPLLIFAERSQVHQVVKKISLGCKVYNQLYFFLDTPYEKGNFLLEIHVPETYPFNPPKVKFLTKIWHPNISSVTGAICLDILKDNWAAAMTLRTVLLSLQALLAAAEPDDPQDAVVANQFRENYEMFCKTAKVRDFI